MFAFKVTCQVKSRTLNFPFFLGTIFSYTAKKNDGTRRSQKMACLEGAIGLGATLGFFLAGIIRELGIPNQHLGRLTAFGVSDFSNEFFSLSLRFSLFLLCFFFNLLLKKHGFFKRWYFFLEN